MRTTSSPEQMARAAQAKAHLKSLGIDINSADNGVFLPGHKDSPNPKGQAVHLSTHTDAYHRQVTRLVLQAETKADAIAALHYIRSALQTGPWP